MKLSVVVIDRVILFPSTIRWHASDVSLNQPGCRNLVRECPCHVHMINILTSNILLHIAKLLCKTRPLCIGTSLYVLLISSVNILHVLLGLLFQMLGYIPSQHPVYVYSPLYLCSTKHSLTYPSFLKHVIDMFYNTFMLGLSPSLPGYLYSALQ